MITPVKNESEFSVNCGHSAVRIDQQHWNVLFSCRDKIGGVACRRCLCYESVDKQPEIRSTRRRMPARIYLSVQCKFVTVRRRLSKQSTRSFVISKRRKTVGPRALPCGTPRVNKIGCERVFLIVNCRVRLFRNNMIHSNRSSVILYAFSLVNSLGCDTNQMLFESQYKLKWHP